MTRNNIHMNRTRLLLILALLATTIIVIYISGCDKLVTETIQTTIAGNPTADFTADQEIGCAPLLVQFTNESDGNYQKTVWDFGDGTEVDTAHDPVHTYNTPGMYNVKLSIYDTLYTGDNPAYQGQDVELKKRFIVVGASTGGIEPSDTVACVGSSITFTPIDTSIVDSVRWNFGDGTAPTTLMVPTHVYDSIGVFSVSLTAYGDCGAYTKTDSDLVRITNCPDITFFADTTEGCVGLAVTFEDTTTPGYTDSTGQPVLISTWEWSFEGGIPATSSSRIQQVTYNQPGQYTVSLTIIDDQGSVKADSIVDYINVLDTVTAAFVALTATQECQIPSRQFLVKFSPTHAEAFDSLQWTFGDGDTLMDLDTSATGGPASPVHAYVNPGQYDVGLTVWGHCGDQAAQIQRDLVILSAPIQPDSLMFNIVPDSGDTSDLFEFADSTNGVVTGWQWDFGDGSALVTDSSTTHKFTAYGDYWVKFTAFNQCGEWTDSMLIQVPDTTGTTK